MGAFAISGIFMLPVWVYVLQSGLALTLGLSDVVQQGVLLLLVVGRILAFFSEVTISCMNFKGICVLNTNTSSVMYVHVPVVCLENICQYIKMAVYT